MEKCQALAEIDRQVENFCTQYPIDILKKKIAKTRQYFKKKSTKNTSISPHC